MGWFKRLTYFFSGLLVIGAVTCAVIFQQSGNFQALAGTVMFLCFGVAGFLLAYHADQLKALIKPGSSERGKRAV